MDTTPIKVLLVDDQALMRMGFRMVLEAHDDLTVIGEAANGRDAITQVSALDPDVVLMDVRMPEMDGIEATAAIVSQFPRTRILILTTFDLDEYAFAGLRAGASGFLLKDARPEDLAAAVRTVASGEAVVSPRITRRMLEMFSGQLPEDDAAQAGSQDDPRLQQLTDRERGVLELIAQGYSNQEIAKQLFLSTTTVKTHVGHILAKLGVRDRVQAVIVAYETGLASTTS